LNDITPVGDCLWSQNIYPGARSKSFVVVESVAFPLGKVNLSESVPTAAPIPQFGMNQVRKQFDTIYDARAGPGEVSVGVHGEDAVS
jgi:hypothetical protein